VHLLRRVEAGRDLPHGIAIHGGDAGKVGWQVFAKKSGRRRHQGGLSKAQKLTKDGSDILRKIRREQNGAKRVTNL
jgi:hypothetical protein